MKTKRVQLKDLKIGDKIKTFDGQKDTFETVTNKFVSIVEHANQMLLTFDNGSLLECSNNHPIMCMLDDKIVEIFAENLTTEHHVIAERGHIVKLMHATKGRNNCTEYIDITVGHTHTFYAANAIDNIMILTHNSQGGTRDGSTTVSYPIWHQEILELAVLKNNKGTDDNRVKNLDYLVQMSKLFINRMLKNETISLFSTATAKDLYSVWGMPEFDEVYLAYEADATIPRKTVQGSELLQTIVTERINTGRIYYMFIDNVNSTSQFIEQITMSNLCVEIVQPTSPIYDVNSEEGEISLCNLGGINLGFLKGPNTFYKLEEPIYRLVKALDTIIDIQDYPVAAARKQLKRRNLGVGVSNFAYWMAKNGLNYNDDGALAVIDELFEHIQYYLIKASVRLAQERGACEWFHKTKYSQGIMPFDNVVQGAKDLVDRQLTLDWEALRAMVLQYGMRNSVLSAQMPVESSSIPQNSTNGIEPPRALRSVKTNKTGGSTVMLMPEADKLASQYTLAWDITSNSSINRICAIIQKWIDQAISVNHYYNPMLHDNKMIPAKQVIQDMVEFYKLGGKNLYYANTLDTIEEQESGCGDGGCTL